MHARRSSFGAIEKFPEGCGRGFVADFEGRQTIAGERRDRKKEKRRRELLDRQHSTGEAERRQAKGKRRWRCAGGARMQGCTDLGLAATSDLRQADRIEISEIGAVYKQLRRPTTPTFPPPRCADSAAKTCRSDRCLGPRSAGSSRRQSKLELSQLTISRQPKELGISAAQAWPHRRGAPAIREMLHIRSTLCSAHDGWRVARSRPINPLWCISVTCTR